MLESLIEKKVVAYCKLRGILTYKFTSPSNRGVPDRIFLFQGRTLFIEFKTDKGRITPLQVREHCRIFDVGHRVRVTYGLRDALNTVATWADETGT